MENGDNDADDDDADDDDHDAEGSCSRLPERQWKTLMTRWHP